MSLDPWNIKTYLAFSLSVIIGFAVGIFLLGLVTNILYPPHCPCANCYAYCSNNLDVFCEGVFK